MSSPKPDYFIASNGLPNILNENSSRLMIRQIPTVNTRNRMLQRNLNCLQTNNVNKCHKNKQNFMDSWRAPTSTLHDESKRNDLNLKKSKKDLINSEIKASNNLEISSTSSPKIEADSKCNWNIERYSKELDNKYVNQRKYDNTIFKHDLPDRIVLPPLPL